MGSCDIYPSLHCKRLIVAVWVPNALFAVKNQRIITNDGWLEKKITCCTHMHGSDCMCSGAISHERSLALISTPAYRPASKF
jgi:hypothetical protein